MATNVVIMVQVEFLLSLYSSVDPLELTFDVVTCSVITMLLFISNIAYCRL